MSTSSSEDQKPSTPKSKLPPTFADKILDQLRNILPENVLNPFKDKQRNLLALERKLQRKFLNEYKSQIKNLEPVLRDRGIMLGVSIVDSFAGHHAARISYADVQKSASSSYIFSQENSSNIKDVVQALDPLIAPVLDPFVEGIKKPINDIVGSFETDIKKAIVATAAVSFLSGIVLGRYLIPSSSSRNK